MIIRPDAVVLPNGSFAPGLEVCIEEGRIDCVRPWTAAARGEVGLLLSPAFVNAHSHLEYRDLQGVISETEYWPWIREITRLKPSRSIDDVQAAANLAAMENKACGVALIGEVSDWPVSGKAMSLAGLGGVIFQEVITIAESEDEPAMIESIRGAAVENRSASGLPVHISAHTPYTASADAIRMIASAGEPNCIHVSESPIERMFFERGEGPIADMYTRFGNSFPTVAMSPVEYLVSLGALHTRTQLVHLCDANAGDIQLIAASGATATHCPRSNAALGCPIAPVRHLLNAGITVGLGLDSPASSGAIDMFAEMHSALRLSEARGEPLTAEQVWVMATAEGARSIFSPRNWSIKEGGDPELILLSTRGKSPRDVIELGARVERVVG